MNQNADSSTQAQQAESQQTVAESPSARPHSFLEWNDVGWTGAVLGSSCWLLISAFFFAGLGWQVTVMGLICFTASVAIGHQLWDRREVLSYLKAVQIFMICSFVLGISFWTCVAAFSHNFSFILKGYLAFAVYPLVAIRINWLAKRQQKVDYNAR